jgi:hypothetical protein
MAERGPSGPLKEFMIYEFMIYDADLEVRAP